MHKICVALALTVVSEALTLPTVRAQTTHNAGDPAFPETVAPPQTANITSFARTNSHFRVKPATSRDLDGQSSHGIPAWTITIKNGVGGWDGPTNLPPPRSVLNVPKKLRDEIALFQVESGFGGGWIAVPRGWRVVSAAAGAQGGWGVTFTAPLRRRMGPIVAG